MNSVKAVVTVFAFLGILWPLNVNAEDTIKLKLKFPEEMIERTIDAWVQSKEYYYSKLTEGEFMIKFEKPARTYIITTYADAEIPTDFRNEEQFPFFEEVVILDVEKVMWQSFRYAVKRNYESYLNFLKQLRKKAINSLNIVKEDVIQSFEFWNCNALPQPPPPKCPPDCAKNSYEATVKGYSW